MFGIYLFITSFGTPYADGYFNADMAWNQRRENVCIAYLKWLWDLSSYTTACYPLDHKATWKWTVFENRIVIEYLPYGHTGKNWNVIIDSYKRKLIQMLTRTWDKPFFFHFSHRTCYHPFPERLCDLLRFLQATFLFGQRFIRKIVVRRFRQLSTDVKRNVKSHFCLLFTLIFVLVCL